MAYTKQQTIDNLYSQMTPIENLYKSKCINWVGETSDTKEFYSEVISNELLRNLKEFDKIGKISRTKSYCLGNHHKIEFDCSDSNRNEENFAKRITGLNFKGLGSIIDYQIPLKDSQSDRAGKIDLISYDEKWKILRLIEFKYEDSKETLLRTVLEIFTYFRIIDSDKLIRDYFSKQGVIPENIKIVPSILITPESNPCKEFEQMDRGRRQKLKTLLLALEIDIFVLDFTIYHEEL